MWLRHTVQAEASLVSQALRLVSLVSQHSVTMQKQHHLIHYTGQKEEKENILNFSIFYQEQTQAKKPLHF